MRTEDLNKIALKTSWPPAGSNFLAESLKPILNLANLVAIGYIYYIVVKNLRTKNGY